MKEALYILLVLVTVLYCRRAWRIYRGLWQAARSSYGQTTAQRRRRGFALRAALWIVPAKLYYRKDIRWWKQWEQLIEKEETE